MNASELTFGIEFETTMPAGSVTVGGYSSGAAVAWLPEGWKAKGDGSIRAGRGRVGCEFVSPVLKGADGVRQVLEVLTALKARGASVNDSTGLHIHVGGFDMSEQNIARLTTLVANFESAIYATTGTDARERSRWCQSVARHGSFDAAFRGNGNGYGGPVVQSRYHVLNLTNLGRADKRTVEFRAFSGTLNPVKVCGYIHLCLGLVERALKAKRKTNWAAKAVKESSPIHRSGEGQTALTRLFYQLGWIKGRTQFCYGDVTAAGAPTHKSMKRQMMKLAKQYDAKKLARSGQ